MAKKPRSVEQFDEFNRALGGALNNWQIIETQCFVLFWHLSLYKSLMLPSILFTHIKSFEQRLALIDNLLVATFAEKRNWPCVEWATIQSRLKAAGQQRHRLVHYSIYRDPKDPRLVTIEPPYYDFARRHGPKAFPKGSSDHYMTAGTVAKVMSSFAALGLDLGRYAAKIEPLCERLQREQAHAVLKQLGPEDQGHPQAT